MITFTTTLFDVIVCPNSVYLMTDGAYCSVGKVLCSKATRQLAALSPGGCGLSDVVIAASLAVNLGTIRSEELARALNTSPELVRLALVELTRRDYLQAV